MKPNARLIGQLKRVIFLPNISVRLLFVQVAFHYSKVTCHNCGLLKRPYSATPLFLFMGESLAIIFYLENAEMNEINMKLLKIMKHTFRNTTYSKAIRFRFTMQCK